MNAKEKSQELVDKFKDYVHGYIGSSMLTNHEYLEQILAQAKNVSIIAVDEILNDLKESFVVAKDLHPHAEGLIAGSLAFWQSVKRELEAL